MSVKIAVLQMTFNCVSHVPISRLFQIYQNYTHLYVYIISCVTNFMCKGKNAMTAQSSRCVTANFL